MKMKSIKTAVLKIGGNGFTRALATKMLLVVLLFSMSQFVRAADSASSLFPDIPGWTAPADIQSFSPDNLYDYIDGASEFYLSFDFQNLQVGEYWDSSNRSVLVEIYRFRSPVLAFGLYSQERPLQGGYLDIGSQGYRESQMLNFLAGAYYVKINSYDLAEAAPPVLEQFARAIAGQLKQPAGLPGILRAFPEQGKIPHSEKFTARNFLGYEFLHSGFKADYELPDRKFSLFILAAENADDARAMLKRFPETAGLEQPKPEEAIIRLKDAYLGDVALLRKGKYVLGTLKLADAGLQETYLRQMAESLPQ